MKKRIAIALAVLALASLSFGQLKEGSLGISPGITFGPVNDAPVIGLAYAVTNDIRLDAGIGLNTISDHWTSFALSLGGAYYLWKVEDVNTFISAGLGFASTSYSGSSTSDESHFGLSGNFGAEYNFNPRFAINGTIGLRIAFGSGHTAFGTTTGTALTWWFK